MYICIHKYCIFVHLCNALVEIIIVTYRYVYRCVYPFMYFRYKCQSINEYIWAARREHECRRRACREHVRRRNYDCQDNDCREH